MNVLAIDVGGTHVKILATGQKEKREFVSGSKMSAKQMVAGVKKLSEDWEYDVISIGYPGRVIRGKIFADPFNLGPGWKGMDFAKAFGKPVKLLNDAAMQALGSYKGGEMLFLGFGTGLGAALVADGVVVPMELGHLHYRKATYEDYVGLRGLERLGKKKWRHHVGVLLATLIEAFAPDDVCLGGGNAEKLKGLPNVCRLGTNDNAFIGGFRMWNGLDDLKKASAARTKKSNPIEEGVTT